MSSRVHHSEAPERGKGQVEEAFLPKPPWFKLRVVDWLSDEVLTDFTAEELGAYVRLLLYAWTSDDPCTLPDDDGKLAEKSRLGRRWKKAGPKLRARFDNVNGRLRDRVLYREYLDMEAQRARRSRAGSKGAAALWQSHGKAVAPIPRPERDHDHDPEQTTESTEAGLDCWAKLEAVWLAHYQGRPGRRDIGEVDPIVRQHGVDEVVRRFTIYCGCTPGRFASVAKFAQTFGEWKQKPTDGSKSSRGDMGWAVGDL